MSKMTYESIPVKDLKIERYNRVINIADAKKKAAEYDERLVGVIVVSRRGGEYHIIDGQHRTYAANILKIPMLMCQVHEGLSYEEEAKLFIKLNKNRRGLMVYDYYKASLEAKDEKTVEVTSAIESLGLHVSRGSGANKIQAISCVMAIYEKQGSGHLVKTLKLIKDTWCGDEKSFGNLMINGVSELINAYGNELKEERFITALRSKAEAYKVLSQANSDMTQCSKKIKVAKVLLFYYNHQLSHKLPNKFV